MQEHPLSFGHQTPAFDDAGLPMQGPFESFEMHPGVGQHQQMCKRAASQQPAQGDRHDRRRHTAVTGGGQMLKAQALTKLGLQSDPIQTQILQATHRKQSQAAERIGRSARACARPCAQLSQTMPGQASPWKTRKQADLHDL